MPHEHWRPIKIILVSGQLSPPASLFLPAARFSAIHEAAQMTTQVHNMMDA